MTIKFKDVGRQKKSWTAKNMTMTFDDLMSQVQPHLISTNVEFTYDDKKNEGGILAGFHTVGTFKVVK